MTYSTRDYQIKAGDVFFFDNNIWMFLFGLIANYAQHKQRAYGKFLEYILQRGRPIHINALVLSEFVNANLRSEYEVWKRKPDNGFANDYKRDFLKSDAYKEALVGVTTAVKEILKITTPGNDDFNAISMDRVFAEMTACDFNDAYYLQYAALRKYIIVTDDGDLYRNNKSAITIITYSA